MHELSIAQAILGVALEEAHGRRVRKVHVVVGHLRQVVPSSLTFGFELLAESSKARGAELEVELVPAAGVCRRCGSETEMDGFPLRCSGCGGLDVDVTRGEELRVDWLELEEPEPGGDAEPGDEMISTGVPAPSPEPVQRAKETR